MAGKPRVNDAEVTAANEIYQRAREQADQEIAVLRSQVNLSHQLGQISGRAQAFGAMKLIGEFLEWKQVAQIIDNEEYLKLPGVTTIDEYLESLGIGRASAYRNLKIARTLTAEEVSLLGQVGFTRRDLLGYAALPEEKRLEIREGKVINIETASREEIKDLVEQTICETKAAKEEAEATIKAKDKVLKDKEAVINKQARELAKFEKDAESRGLTPDEDACLQQIENLRMSFDGYMQRLDPAFILNEYDEVTPRMRAAAVSAIHYMKMQVLAAYDIAVTTHGNPTMNPELLEDFHRWEQESMQQM
jgi:hypothetical protein